MPDWSYHPLFRPWLFRLPPERARGLLLGALGRLGTSRIGPAAIDFMGHMRPPAELEQSALGRCFATPVGIGAGVDPHALAAPALARFGVGFVELGPVTAQPLPPDTSLERHPGSGTLVRSALPVNDGVDALVARLDALPTLGVPLGIRLAHQPGSTSKDAAVEYAALIRRLAPRVAFWSLETAVPGAERWSDEDWQYFFGHVMAAIRACPEPRPVLICIPPDTPLPRAHRLIELAVAADMQGVLVGGGVLTPDGRRLTGAPTREQSLALVRAIYAGWGRRVSIVGAGGVHSPADVLAMLGAGASLVQLGSGLVFSGPGLPKRANEALLFEARKRRPAPPVGRGWLWVLLLGVGMMLGGMLAWIVAATRVVLPYDEAFVGLGRDQLAALNPRLLPFMAHDRVTLAGTMLSIGILYAQLAVWALRDGAHWAWRTVRVSAGVGFASFFLFLGFGYFDPLHALVTVLLLPFLLLGARARRQAPAVVPVPDLANDRAWRAASWGQLLFVGLGFGLIVGGITIAGVGITRVFVPEDLTFLGTTAEALRAANPRLVALVAHDRAGFGGALVSDGLAVLLIALWGMRRGARWVWWTLLLGGLPGFWAAISVHTHVGYIDAWHLAPVWLAVAVYAVALALLYPYLVGAACASNGDPGTPAGVAVR